MIRQGILLPSFLAIGVAAAAVPQDPASQGHPGGRRDLLARLSQRLDAGDPAAIDELLACTQPATPGEAPSAAEIERLRQEVARLRASASIDSEADATVESPVARPRDAEATVREARAWMHAGDPLRCLKALSSTTASGGPFDGEVAFWKGCALERLGRDAEALEQYRHAADAAVSPVLKLAAASGVDHVTWLLHRAGSPEAKP